MYWLDSRSLKNDHTVPKNISKISKRMTAQIKPHAFDAFAPILIIGFLCNFKLARDTNRMDERAAICVSHFFSNKPASFALHTRLASKYKTRTRVNFTGKTTTLTTDPWVVSYFLWTYLADENIAHTEDYKPTFIHPPNEIPLQYAKKLVANTLRCGDVQNEQDLNESFLMRLNKSIREGRRGYYSTQKNRQSSQRGFSRTDIAEATSRIAKNTFYKHGQKQEPEPKTCVENTKFNGTRRQVLRHENKFPWKRIKSKIDAFAIRTASSRSHPLSCNLSPHESSTKVSTNGIKPCEVCFDKWHHTLDCPLVSNKQKKQLTYLEEVNVQGLQPGKAVLHGDSLPAYLGVRRDHNNPYWNKPSFQSAKQPGAVRHQIQRLSKK